MKYKISLSSNVSDSRSYLAYLLIKSVILIKDALQSEGIDANDGKEEGIYDNIKGIVVMDELILTYFENKKQKPTSKLG